MRTGGSGAWRATGHNSGQFQARGITLLLVFSAGVMKSIPNMRRNGRYVFVLVILFVTVGSVQGQRRSVRPNAEAPQRKPADPVDNFKEDFIRASEDYKASLQTLLLQYESDVKKLTDRSANWKELYSEGIISQREYEAKMSSVSEAQVKIDELRKQIKSVEITVAEARNGPRLDDSDIDFPSHIAPPWTTGNGRIDSLIRQNAERYGVDAYLIYCVIHQESNFSSTALSVKGARGLMQLMPGTAARYGVIDANDPAQNIMGGTRYLKDLLRLFSGRIDLVLAAYNAGEGAVIKYGQTVPPYKETQDYVRLISLRYLRKKHDR
jgi:soluble lytic murein transglycosylase-like protein